MKKQLLNLVTRTNVFRVSLALVVAVAVAGCSEKEEMADLQSSSKQNIVSVLESY